MNIRYPKWEQLYTNKQKIIDIKIPMYMSNFRGQFKTQRVQNKFNGSVSIIFFSR